MRTFIFGHLKATGKQEVTNSMKYFITLWLLTSFFLYGEDKPNALIETIQRLSSLQDLTDRDNDTEYMEVSGEALHAWDKASDEEKNRFSSKMFLVHYRRAQIMAASGNFKTAADELAEEAQMQKIYDGRLEFATKSPDVFFRGLAELQALLTAENGTDPLESLVGYSFEKVEDCFIASRLELYDEIAGIPVPGIGTDEAIALVYRVDQRGDKYVVSATRWLIVPTGELPDVLDLATREIIFDTTGKMVVGQFKPKRRSIRPDRKPKVAEGSFNPSSNAQTPVPQASEKKPSKTKTVSKSTSLLSWTFIIIIVSLIGGILWLLLKIRS